METFVVIMAGGRGERFWPKSTKEMPKQFLSLWGTDTLLQQAFARALKVTGDAAGVYVITGPDYEGLVRAQLAELPPENLIIEPAGRDTAPAVGYAAVYLGGRRKDAVMVVLPSDHVVLDDERFAETLRYAAGVAQKGDYLVTIGIRPTRPEEGYGYIECGEPLDVEGLAGTGAQRGDRKTVCYRARRFTEKPRVDEALAFLKTGRYLWNAGIFVWTISAFRHALARHAPLLHEGLCQIERSLEEGFDAVREKFLTLERRSIDYALMEKAENIVVVPGDFGWDDVGTWAALERIYDKDENGNVIKGEAVAIEAGGNIIDNSLGDKLVVAFGVKDLVIVNSEDVVLVAYNFFSEDPLVWLVATFTALVFVLIVVGVGPKGCKIIAVVLRRPGASLGILGEILNYTKWVALSGIAYIAMPYLARFILAVRASVKEVGIFSAGITFTMAFSTVNTAVRTVLFPQVTALESCQEMNSYIYRIRKIVPYYFVLAAVDIAALGSLQWLILGAEYRAALPVFLITACTLSLTIFLGLGTMLVHTMR